MQTYNRQNGPDKVVTFFWSSLGIHGKALKFCTIFCPVFTENPCPVFSKLLFGKYATHYCQYPISSILLAVNLYETRVSFIHCGGGGCNPKKPNPYPRKGQTGIGFFWVF